MGQQTSEQHLEQLSVTESRSFDAEVFRADREFRLIERSVADIFEDANP